MLKYQTFLPSGLAIMAVFTSTGTQILNFNTASHHAMAETNLERQSTMDSTTNKIINKFLKTLPTSRSTTGKKQQTEISKSSINRIIDIFRKKKRKGGSRTSSCIILSETVKDSLQTWSDRPLFVWEGAPKRVGIRSIGNKSMIWSHEVADNEQSIQFDGEVPLERGQEYTYWIQYSPLVEEEDLFGYQVSFQVMSDLDYRQLHRKLSQVDLNAPNSNNKIPDPLILKRAYYFAQQELFLDAVRELFLFAERSPSVVRLDALQCILSDE